MSKRWRLLPGARRDIEEAYDWDEQERAGLGIAFARCVRTCLDEAREMPAISTSAVVQGRGLRRVMVADVPYYLLFVEYEDEYVVLTVEHGSRGDDHWLARTRR